MKRVICFFSIILFVYVLYCFSVSFSIMKDVKFRTEQFIDGCFYDYDNCEFRYREFEDVTDYDIKCKIICCFPFIGIGKGVILYKKQFEAYQKGKLISGSWENLFYGKFDKIYVERKGWKWDIIGLVEAL